MAKRSQLDLTPEEQLVVEQALTEPIWGVAQFTDFFMRDESTGSWFTPEEDDFMYDRPTRYNPDGSLARGTTMYSYLRELWEFGGKPRYSLVGEPPAWARYYINHRGGLIEYEVRMEGNEPHFFWSHGWLPMQWGAWAHYAKQPNHTILGGFGSSKTTHVGISGFVHCATIPHFMFVGIAAYQAQIKPMYDEVVNTVVGTPAEKFIAIATSNQLRISEKPNPAIYFKNGSQMLFIGADKDLDKIRSLTVDWAVLEQAESHSDFEGVRRELGSRRRGRVRGRKRMGRFTKVANSGEAPELWEEFDRAEYDPERWLSISLSSYDNVWLTARDIETFEKDVCGGNTDEIAQYMMGMKPVGQYKDFPKEVVERCQDTQLDVIMTSLRQEGAPGAYLETKTGCGCTLWSLPPQPNRDYAVYGDPGTKDPPGRGASVVIVTDETSFPEKPAEIVHFEWVFGGGRIGPFINAFQDAVVRYNAQGRAYFEGTGEQVNMNETVFEELNLIVEAVNMSGGLKHGMKIKLLRILERGLLKWARAISPIRIQLSKYDEMEDKTTSSLPQDIVTVLMIIASQLGPRMIEPGEISKRTDVVRHAMRSGGYKRIGRSAKRPRR